VAFDRLPQARQVPKALVVFGEPAETAGGGDAGPGDRVAARFAMMSGVFGELVMDPSHGAGQARAELIDRGQKANALKVTNQNRCGRERPRGASCPWRPGAVDGLDGALQSAKKHQRRFGRGVEHRFRPRSVITR